jgi:hypothetical protein
MDDMSKKLKAVEPMTVSDHLDPAEQALLEQLVTEAQEAQRLANKLTEKLAVKYLLRQGDGLDYKTGIITRADTNGSA